MSARRNKYESESEGERERDREIHRRRESVRARACVCLHVVHAVYACQTSVADTTEVEKRERTGEREPEREKDTK